MLSLVKFDEVKEMRRVKSHLHFDGEASLLVLWVRCWFGWLAESGCSADNFFIVRPMRHATQVQEAPAFYLGKSCTFPISFDRNTIETRIKPCHKFLRFKLYLAKIYNDLLLPVRILNMLTKGYIVA